MPRLVKPTHEQFVKSVKMHAMDIVIDDGVHRHIRFRNPGTSNLHFEITTWPEYLCISGDMGTYAFKRLYDMFQFFRQSDKNVGRINPGYWHEKLASDSLFEPARKFSHDLFEKIVKDEFKTACKGKVIPLRDRKEIWENIELFVLDAETNESAHEQAYRFGPLFSDFCEHDLTEFTYHFVWCLRAIVWGIRKYDSV